ncbi:MAG: hypothetical protein ACI9HI_002077 [Salinirussus sp.]
MAGLSPPDGPGTDSERPPEEDRAQVILVAAFSLAVAFVALSVVINGAIFTQNLATRGDTAGGGDALQQRQQAEQMVVDLLEHTNANYSDDRSMIETEFTAAVGDLSNSSASQQSITGRAVDYAFADASDGVYIYNRTDAFTNESGTTDWTVASNVSDVRGFNIRIPDASDLSSSPTGAFTLNLSTGADTWEMRVYEDSGDVAVETTDGNGNTGVCSAPEPADINVTAGLVGGNPCEPLDFGENLTGSYDIVYNNGGQAEGDYSLVINETTNTDVGDVPNDNEDDILYSATVEYTYRTANLVYETDIRVAPGEPDE